MWRSSDGGQMCPGREERGTTPFWTLSIDHCIVTCFCLDSIGLCCVPGVPSTFYKISHPAKEIKTHTSCPLQGGVVPV